MNIVYVSDQYWPSVSGVPVSMDSFKENFAELGHKVSLLVPEYPEAEQWDKENNSENIFRFRSRSIFFNKENRMVRRSEKNKIHERLKIIAPDVIHVHTEFSLAKVVIKYARKNNIPVVLTAHTNWEELINEYISFIPKKISQLCCRSFLRRIFNRVDLVIAPTKLMASRLVSYSVNKPIEVIPTGLSLEKFAKNGPVESNHEANVQFEILAGKVKGKKTLMYVGRLGKEKNIKFLIDVFHSIQQTINNVTFVIVGDGPSRAELEEHARFLGIKEKVIFTGFVARERLKDFYSLAYVFMFASKVESQGLVILESMACGTPVVAIGEMGTRALMASGRGGFMVDDNIDLFIAMVELLLKDSKVYAEKSAEALQEAQEWGSELMSSKVLTLYEDLLVEKGKLNAIQSYEKYVLDDADYSDFIGLGH
ncbi:MAG: glycosyltransferase [Bacteriovorax sp.]|nr:glycosyltransferase [Bacteriovorax sp.]